MANPAGVAYLAKIALGGDNTVGAICPDLGGAPLVHATDPDCQDISTHAVHPDSDAILALMSHNIEETETWPTVLECLMHPTHYGFPFVTVPGTQALVPIEFHATFGFPLYSVDEAPVPASFPLEGTAAGDPTPSDYPNDQHGIIVVRDETTGGVAWIYEMYSVYKPTEGSNWTVTRTCVRYAGDSYYSDLPDGYPLTTAGGTRILPALITYDDVYTRGVIDHALRMTMLSCGPAHIPTASTAASGNPVRAPMGTRIRLKASVDISGFSAAAQVVLQAMKTYGAVIDDNGPNFQLQGTRDARWAAYALRDELNLIDCLTDCEVLDYGPGYTMTQPESLYGDAGVESGAWTIALAEPTNNVAISVGGMPTSEVGGGVWRDYGPGGGR